MKPTITGDELPPTGGPTVAYVVTVMAEAGQLLQSITIRDRDDAVVEDFEPPLEPCVGQYYEGRAAAIPRTSFPLKIEVIYCDGQRFSPDDNPALHANTIIDPPIGVVDCGPESAVPPTPECLRANASAQRFRSELERLCREVADCRRAYREYLAMAAALYVGFVITLAAGLAAAQYGGWIGAIVAIVAFALAAALLYISKWATVQAVSKRRELDDLEPRLRQARTNFQAALEHVFFHCCPRDWPEDREMPC